MSKEEALEQVIDIASHNMDWFIGIISVLVAFFAFYQWFLNDKQINRLKEDMRHEYEAKLKDSKQEILQSLRFKRREGQVFIKSPRTFNSYIKEIKNEDLTLVELEIGFSWSPRDGAGVIHEFVKTSINDYLLSGEFQLISTDGKASASLIQNAQTGSWTLSWNKLPQDEDKLYSLDFHHVWIDPPHVIGRPKVEQENKRIE